MRLLCSFLGHCPDNSLFAVVVIFFSIWSYTLRYLRQSRNQINALVTVVRLGIACQKHIGTNTNTNTFNNYKHIHAHTDSQTQLYALEPSRLASKRTARVRRRDASTHISNVAACAHISAFWTLARRFFVKKCASHDGSTEIENNVVPRRKTRSKNHYKHTSLGSRKAANDVLEYRESTEMLNLSLLLCGIREV